MNGADPTPLAATSQRSTGDALRESSSKAAALAYALRLGWAVFPCFEIGSDGRCACGAQGSERCTPAKHPRTHDGFRGATRSVETITRWWSMWPNANVAIATGEISGIVVVDIDPRNGGRESLLQIHERFGRMDPSIVCLSGGGGAHAYFAHPGRHVPNRSNLAGFRGIDLKGDGGYVLAPPSSHVSGDRYAWQPGHTPWD
jgi:hypothetical protein